MRLFSAFLTTLLASLNETWCPGLVTKPEPRHEPWNIKWASELAREVKEADAAEGLELVFYGDSITEQWRGSDQGGACARCIGDPAIFDKYFGSKYRSLVLAVGGDQVGHLEWRLTHGDVPEVHQPRLAVVMIGTNDLGAASDCSGGDAEFILKAAEGVKARINATILLMREKMPETHVLALSILPRGDARNSSSRYAWPGIYTPAMHSVNSWMEGVAKQEAMISFLDCGPMLLVNGRISPVIQGDGLHPSPEGMLILAKCLSPMVYALMGLRHSADQGSLVHDLSGFFSSLGRR